MPREPGHGRAKKGLAFAHIAFMAALFPPLFLLLCMMVTHLGYVNDDVGFRILTLRWGPLLAEVTLAISALSLLISLFLAPRRCAPWALGAVVISGALLAGFTWYQKTLKTYPPIADVATNWDRPVTFSDKLIADRGPGAKPVEDLPRVPRDESLEWGGKTIPDINALTCPGAHSILRRHFSEDQVAGVLQSLHYTVFGHAPWRVEATYEDSFYGFKSDLVVRLDPGRVDVRSVSRYDMPDMGLNCRHVLAVLGKLNALPDAADDSAPAADSDASAADASVPVSSALPPAAGDDGGDE